MGGVTVSVDVGVGCFLVKGVGLGELWAGDLLAVALAVGWTGLSDWCGCAATGFTAAFLGSSRDSKI